MTSLSNMLKGIPVKFSFNDAVHFTSCGASNFSFYQAADVGNITEITFPNTLTAINAYSFQDAASLVKVVVPPSVTTMSGEGTFRRCRALRAFICLGTTPPVRNRSNQFDNTTCIFYVPDEAVDAYKTASYWSSLSSRIKPISEYIE